MQSKLTASQQAAPSHSPRSTAKSPPARRSTLSKDGDSTSTDDGTSSAKLKEDKTRGQGRFLKADLEDEGDSRKRTPTSSISGDAFFRRTVSPSVAAVTGLSSKEYGSSDSQKKGKKGEDHPQSAPITLTRIRDYPRSQQLGVFRERLHLCSVLYDFNLDSHSREKELKRQMLIHLIDFITHSKMVIDEETVRELVGMIRVNILRVLKVQDRGVLELHFDVEDDPTFFDPAWPHLEYVYELFSRLLSGRSNIISSKIVRECIGSSFVHALFEYFDSDDGRERTCLKSVVSQMYAKHSKLRDTITQALRSALVQAAYESDGHKGVKELLELASDLTKGFSVGVFDIKSPKDFLTRILLPLHKLPTLHDFHLQLMNCIKRYVELDARLTYVIITRLLKVWPVAVAAKQVLFLDEIEEILKMTPQIQFRRMQDALVRRIALCIESPHYQVAERALLLWNTEAVVKLVNQNARSLLPQLIGPLSKAHWYGAVNQRLPNVMQLLKETNESVYNDSQLLAQKEAKIKVEKQASREERWAALQQLFNNTQQKRLEAEIGGKSRSSSKGHAVHGSKVKSASRNSSRSASPTLRAQEFWGEQQVVNGGSSSSTKGKKTASRRTAVKVSTRWANLQLKEERYGVAVRWQQAVCRAKLVHDLQALIVDSQGVVIDAVHAGRSSACQAAVRQLLQARVGGEDLKPHEYDSIIWVTLPRLPPEAELLIFFISSGGEVPVGEAMGSIHILELERGNNLGLFTVERTEADVGALVTIQRCHGIASTTASPKSMSDEKDGHSLSEACWMMSRIEGCVRQGRHFMDIWEPGVGDLVRSVMPKVPKSQRLTLPVEKGDTVELPDSAIAKWLYIGVAWDFLPPYLLDGFRLDVSAVLFNSRGGQVGAVTPDNADDIKEFSMQHSGNGLLSEGITIDWDAIPGEVSQVFIVGNVPQNGANLGLVDNISATVVDPGGTNLIRYQLGHGSERPGIIIARVVRDDDSRKSFQALGVFCNGRTWTESLPDMLLIFHQPIDGFMSSTVASTFRSQTGAGGSTRFRMSL